MDKENQNFTHWLAVGMSGHHTPGFQDTSRLMSDAFPGAVAYIEPPRPFAAWRKMDGAIFHWSLKKDDGCTVLTPPLPIPRKFDPMSLGFKRQAAHCAQGLSNLWGPDWRSSTVCYVTNWTPHQLRLIQALAPKYLVLDFVDDVLSFPHEWNPEFVVRSWKTLAQMATTVLCVSEVLKTQMFEKLGVDAVLAPNGVNAKMFMSRPNTIPKEIVPSENRVRAGFAGTLNHWIDYSALLHLARTFPDVDFFLMGRKGNLGGNEQENSLTKLMLLSNVKYCGPIPYRNLPEYLHAMDILLLPRIACKASEASSPLKLYEYLAVGKPVVITGVHVPREVRDLVYSSQTSSIDLSFRNARREIDGFPSKLSSDRHAYAVRHTWEERMKVTLNALRKDDRASNDDIT